MHGNSGRPGGLRRRARDRAPVGQSRPGRGTRARTIGLIDTLEPRLLFAVDAGVAAAHVDAKLLTFYDGVVTGGQNPVAAAATDHLLVQGPDRVSVTVQADRVARVTAAMTARLGFQLQTSRVDLHFAEGTLPINRLRSVGKLVTKVGRYMVLPTFAPITSAGSVNSQADFVMEADRQRATSPGLYDGTGQRVGVLSDSYNHLNGASAGVASGDLPAGVTVLADSNSSSDADEGRAMMELIHDVAPGASLAFATANGGEATFANNIRALANPASYGDNKGAGVIVDDVQYLAEPMFQDGVIAQAIDEVATTRGVNYFSAAGNQASQSYESTTFSTSTDTIKRSVGNQTITGQFYDFDPGAGVDTRQQITVPAGAQVLLVLQWDDPYYKIQTDATHVDTDLDVYLVDPSTNRYVGGAASNNLANNTPYEVFSYTNSGSTAKQLDLMIQKFTGPDSGRIKYVNFGNSTVTIDQFATNSSTLVPHAAAVNGQGVAAVRYYQQSQPEYFTSKGGATILFSPAGDPIAPQSRQSPQVTAVDGSNTTFFYAGSLDPEADGIPNFFGTSAAAPNAAAVAALVRQANPGFTPAQVYQRLQNTADDLTTGGATVGFDALTGYGLVNAFEAVYPTLTTASLNYSDGLESGALSTNYETRSTAAGHIQVTGANGPATGAKHLTLDATVPGNTSLNEVTLHVNAGGAGTKTLSFREKEFGDDDNAMPASFTDSSNSDGVALSVDGVNWYRVVSLTGGASTNTYTLYSFDLSAIAAADGITLGPDTRIRFQQYDDSTIGNASDPDGIALDDISVTSTTASAAPGAPDLLAATDTGTSAADDRTNRDNSTAAKNLQFSVTGTTGGATVSVYADGTLIGTATAPGSTTTVATSGSFDLTDGSHTITARQTVSGSAESVDSTALSITIDTAAPTADVADVSPDPRTVGVSSVAVNFSEAVAGFDLTDLSLTRDGGSNLLTGTNAPTGGSTNYTVPNLLAPTSVSGTYVLTVTASGSGITDIAGNAFAVDGGDTWVHSLPAWLSAAGTAASWNSQTKALAVTGAATITADPATDAPAIAASGASAVLTINPPTGSVINVATLSLADGAVATMANHGANAARALVLDSDPTIAAGTKLDLTNNVLVVRNGTLSGIRSQVAATFAGGTWNGIGGIASATAAADAAHNTALGVASNATLNKTSFAGVTGLTSAAVFVKYTYYGDGDLSGNTTLDDFTLFLNGYQNSGNTWSQGDYDYSGLVTLDDFTLFLKGYQNQGAPL